MARENENISENLIEQVKTLLVNDDIKTLYKLLKSTSEDIDKLVDELERYIDEQEYKDKISELRAFIEQEKKRNKIKNDTSDNLVEAIKAVEIDSTKKSKETFDSLDRLSSVFAEWRQHPTLSFKELYNNFYGKNEGTVQDESIEQPTELPTEEPTTQPSIDEPGPSGKNEGIIQDEGIKQFTTKQHSRDIDISIAELGSCHDEDYCLFNLILDHQNKFKLSEFLRKSSSRQQYNYDLKNTILYTFFDNFCEQLEYFSFFEDGDTIDNSSHINIQNPGAQSILNFSAVQLQKPESISLKDCTTCIRNAIAHNEYHIITRDEMYIKTDYNNGFEAIVDLSFFDDCFNFAQHSKTLPLDYTENINGIRRAFKCENIDGTQIPSMYTRMLNNPQKVLPDVFTNDYHHVGINTNNARRDKERMEGLLANNVNFGLISDTNKPYVHNLFNAVLLHVLDMVFQNPNITYEDLIDKATISKLCDKLHLFSMDDRHKIISLCLDMIGDILSLGKLKMFYINMLDIPQNNRTLEEREDAHKRDALIHGYYNIANGKIIMWDKDKRNGGRMSWDKHSYLFDDVFKNPNFQNKLQKSMSRGVSLGAIEQIEELANDE